MVRNDHEFTIFQFVHSPFFQLYQCVRREPAILGIFSHIPNFALPLLPPACVKLYPSFNKKIVRNRHSFNIFQFVHSQFFQLNQCVRCELTILGIFYHRPNLARLLLPPACVQCKNKCDDPSNIYSSFTHQVFN